MVKGLQANAREDGEDDAHRRPAGEDDVLRLQSVREDGEGPVGECDRVGSRSIAGVGRRRWESLSRCRSSGSREGKVGTRKDRACGGLGI
ncbi:hypothetical protein Cni_G25994 [Canna indica]|uniref:Uncharacterized protein n=1 Tax=Canna indica TaxID=4628 RepID=A0AAQ3QQX1_9LILI|nr:hypothetical protein Cni_G25994 [Canna indica]